MGNYTRLSRRSLNVAYDNITRRGKMRKRRAKQLVTNSLRARIKGFGMFVVNFALDLGLDDSDFGPIVFSCLGIERGKLLRVEFLERRDENASRQLPSHQRKTFSLGIRLQFACQKCAQCWI